MDRKRFYTITVETERMIDGNIFSGYTGFTLSTGIHVSSDKRPGGGTHAICSLCINI